MSDNENLGLFGQSPFEKDPQPSLTMQAPPPQSNKVSLVRRIVRFLMQTNIIPLFQTRPLLATFILLGLGAGLSAAAVSSLSSSPAPAQDIPVIRAQTTAFKTHPKDPGGMRVPNEDSTVYALMRDEGFEKNAPRAVKNLLDSSEKSQSPAAAMTEKVSTFEQQAKALLKQADAKKHDQTPAPEVMSTDSVKARLERIEPASGAAQKPVKKPIIAAQRLSRPSFNDQKNLLSMANKAQIAPQARSAMQAKTKTKPKTYKRPDALHAAGSSPETLAFVRSVLEKKDKQAPAKNLTKPAARLAKTEPAAGDDKTISAAAPTGTYFVQLGSVSSPAGADQEWKKLSSALNIGGEPHRVQNADLGARGTFYRIQAGPYTQAQANSLCARIKQQKPGGCLVIQ